MGIFVSCLVLFLVASCSGSGGSGPQSLENRVALPPPRQMDESGQYWHARIQASFLLSNAESSWQVRDVETGDLLRGAIVQVQDDHTATIYIYRSGFFYVEATVREGSRSVTRRRMVEVQNGATGFTLGLEDLPPGMELLLLRRQEGEGDDLWEKVDSPEKLQHQSWVRFINLHGDPSDYQLRLRPQPDEED